MGRAVAHGHTGVEAFDDPTASVLLPDDARARVARFHAGTGKGFEARFDRVFLDRQAKIMVARTVAIDEAVRSAGNPQLVNLGAGLDGRAWRMPELADAVVFEVDHPDTQREKMRRVTQLAPAAGEIRFVPVDFTRDSLDEALEAAGHDPNRPTTWIWEGVVMYLTPADIEATLQVIARRSATSSRVSIAYHSPSFLLKLVGLVHHRLGEPFRSEFTPPRLRALLARHGFHIVRDEDVAGISRRLAPENVRALRPIKYMRIATADCRRMRAPSPATC